MANEIVDAIASPMLPALPQEPTYAPGYEVFLDFFSSIIGSLAWPVVVIGVVYFFKDQIIAMVNNVESVKVGGVEAKIRRDLEGAAEYLKASEPVTPQVANLNQDDFQRLANMSDASPTGAIIEAWKRIEGLAIELAMRDMKQLPQLHPAKLYNSMNLLRFLQTTRSLPPSELSTFQKLREIRNRAAHSSDTQITPESAREYVRLADRLFDVMTQALTAPEMQPSLFDLDQGAAVNVKRQP